MLAVELKCDSTPELMQFWKKYPCGRSPTRRGMLRCPSGANVSELRTPPPNVTMITLFEDRGRPASCARSRLDRIQPGRIRLAIESPASCTKRRFDRLAINTP